MLAPCFSPPPDTNRTHVRLFANSRLTRRLRSLSTCAAQQVGLTLRWCWGRCRTFLEFGAASGRTSGIGALTLRSTSLDECPDRLQETGDNYAHQ